jgi:hypothetical protein
MTSNDAGFTGQKCPKCGEQIVYDGNYRCEGYDEGWCDWGMADVGEDDPLFRRCFVGLMKRDYPERLADVPDRIGSFTKVMKMHRSGQLR